MNIKKIREMPSKELCKIVNPNTMNINESSVSPIKAMMIGKPQDDIKASAKSLQRYSNAIILTTGANSNRVSLKSSNRHSIMDNERPTLLTPQHFKHNLINQKRNNSRNPTQSIKNSSV